jgi:hypothetical protein
VTPPAEGLDRDGILAWLSEDDPARLERLWAAADETRRRHVGDEVHLPDKACVNETAEMCRGCLTGRVESIGRVIGSGPGGRRRAGQEGETSADEPR